jgi:glc operon protein GlcG
MRNAISKVMVGYCLACLVLAAFASRVPAQESPAAGSSAASNVRDSAGMFSADAVKKAREELSRFDREYHVPVVIETVESLRGEPVEEAATRLARASGREGIFVLLSKADTKIETLVSRPFRDVLSRSDARTVSDAFVKQFREGRFDAGLADGVHAIGSLLAKARLDGRVAARTSQLVLRNQVRLTLAGARKILEGAEAKASAMNLKVNIAVVDDGGHPVSFERMDGARPASAYTATTKAVTAATFRQPTGPLPAGTSSPDPLLNLSLQNAAAASGGKITTLFGGVPVVVEGQVIGGVGVGGGSGEQDATIARAGVQALLSDLGEPVAGSRNE